MDLWSAITIGFKEIWAHKFRSLLTMLGIILGVSSLVAMSALVQGMENGMKEALIAIGGLEKVRIEPQEVPVHQKHLEDQAVGCTINDVFALKNSAPLINMVTPEMSVYRTTVSRGKKAFRPFIISGTWPSALEMNQHVLAHGRMFNDLDEENARNVCVIGTATRDELFGSPEETGQEIVPLGETLNIGGQLFTIIGMFQHYESEQERLARELEKKNPKKPEPQTGPARSRGFGGGRRGGGFVFWLKNATIYMPLNTMWIKFRASTGTNNIPDPRLSGLSFKVNNLDRLDETLQQARNVLMSTHNGIEDFAFRTQENWSENITTSIRNARMSGGIIAAISLIVGGIGIMNIMFASITERVREIGLRKAIGATNFSVFVQILVESLVIAVIGAVAGLITSYGLVQVLIFISPADNTPVITFGAMVVAFCFSAGIGLLAGLLPAFKASRLDPIQALRYE